MDSSNATQGFCSVCGAPLNGGAFCGSCGAKVVATAVHAPIPEAESAPVIEVAPVAVATPAEEPVLVAQPAPRAWKFPLAPVILIGIATIFLFVTMCQGFYFGNIMSFVCATVVLVGMIVCRKERNLFVGLAFLGMAIVSLVGIIISFSTYLRAGAGIFTALIMQLFTAANVLCYIAYGIVYLVAKPKLAILKIIISALTAGFQFFGLLCVVIVAIVPTVPVSAPVAPNLLRFLLYTAPLCLGAILYTPFKKR